MATQPLSLNISLPEAVREWVESRVNSGEYGTASEYIHELVREDQRRKAREALDQKLIEGLNGEVAEMTTDDWKHIRSEVQRRLEAGHAGNGK